MKRPIKTIGSVRPNFARLKLASKNYKRNFWNAMHFAHNELSTEQLKKETLNWAKRNEYDMDILNAMDKNDFTTVGKVFFILNNEGEISDDMFKSNKLLLDRIIHDRNLPSTSMTEPEQMVRTTRPKSEIILAQAQEVGAVFDKWIDDYIDDKIDDITKRLPNTVFEIHRCSFEHTEIIKHFFDSQIDEYKAVIKGDDRELVEAYRSINRIKIKRILKFFDMVHGACDVVAEQHAEEQRAKQKTPEELVANLKYHTGDSILKLYSESVSDIIGAKEVWVYNTKNRKIGVYYAGDMFGLSVKGSNIINYNEDTSVEKTLFKPKEHIKEFRGKSIGKISNAFGGLSTLDTKMSGKITEHCIIFKIG